MEGRTEMCDRRSDVGREPKALDDHQKWRLLQTWVERGNRPYEWVISGWTTSDGRSVRGWWV